MIEAGQPAPEFTLKRGDGSDFTQADLQGTTTVLVFYPFAFSPVCTDQLNLYEEVLGDLHERGATMYAVSCDASPVADRVSGEARRQHRAALGLRAQGRGRAAPSASITRAAFPSGRWSSPVPTAVRWSYQAPSPGDLPGANLIFDALDA